MAHPGDTGGGGGSLQLLRGRHQQGRHEAVALRVLGERGHVEVLVVVAGVVILEAPHALAGLAGAGKGEDGQEGDEEPHGGGHGGEGGGGGGGGGGDGGRGGGEGRGGDGVAGEEGAWPTVWR